MLLFFVFFCVYFLFFLNINYIILFVDCNFVYRITSVKHPGCFLNFSIFKVGLFSGGGGGGRLIEGRL